MKQKETERLILNSFKKKNSRQRVAQGTQTDL